MPTTTSNPRKISNGSTLGTQARMGVSLDGHDKVIALAGNPNTGKSTVFNHLTGLKQHTGNWPGKTVTRAEGSFTYNHFRYKLVDLPGTYSLLSASTDEEVARNFILFGQPDCTIVVVDATVLERNLNLVFQVMEITDKVVLCVNLMDEAKRKGIAIDSEQLEFDLGIPTIPTVARVGQGIDDLLAAVAGIVHGTIQTAPKVPPPPAELREAIDELVPMIEAVAPGIPNARWIAYRLLEGDLQVRQALLANKLGTLASTLSEPHRCTNHEQSMEAAS